MLTFKRFTQNLESIPIVFSSLVMLILMMMTFADVMMRSLFNMPIEAATELTRMFMALIVFSILPVVSGRSAHIEVDLLDPIFFKNVKFKAIRDAIVSLACGLILILPAKQVVVLAERARSYGDVTEYLSIPQFYIGWFIAIMTSITAVVLILRAMVLFYTCINSKVNND